MKAIGSKVGKVLEVEWLGKGDVEWKRLFRIRVNIEISNLMLPSLLLPRHNFDDLWISSKYEKEADNYYRCGVVGHDAQKFLL